MFWCDVEGSKQKILRSDLNGQNVAVLYSRTSVEHIALDHVSEKYCTRVFIYMCIECDRCTEGLVNTCMN